ncbi:MAG: ATP-binding protein [Pseudomonadota bacterium]
MSENRSHLAARRDQPVDYANDATLEELKLAIDNSRTGISWLDPEGFFRRVRDGYARMLGYSADELLGQSWAVTVPESDHADGIAGVQKMLREGRATVETRAVRKDGSVFYKRLLLVKTTDADGNHTGHFCFMTDISETKEAQHRLVDAERLKTIGTLAGGIAHDLNNLLTPILGRAELLTKNPRELESSAGAIRDAAQRAQELIDRLLRFSKQEREDRTPVSLIAAVRIALQFVSGSLPANVSVQTRFEATADTVFGVEAPLELVVMNLVTNAGHAMQRHGGTLDVAVTNPSSSEVLLEIADTGTGIPSASLKRIFDPFYTTKAPAEGTGLGLLMVKEAVTEMDGSVSVESQEGQGTVFRVVFPLCKEEPSQRGEDAAPETPSLRILLVDDDESVLSVCRAMLEHLGHGVVCFTDPATALTEKLGEYDLVISDYRISGSSGIEFARKLTGFGGAVILMSGHFDSHEEVPGNVVACINKPFQISDLQVAILGAWKAKLARSE